MLAVALAIAGTILWACGSARPRFVPTAKVDRAVFWTGLALIAGAFVLGGM
jgi:hypothetical protein